MRGRWTDTRRGEKKTGIHVIRKRGGKTTMNYGFVCRLFRIKYEKRWRQRRRRDGRQRKTIREKLLPPSRRTVDVRAYIIIIIIVAENIYTDKK